MSVYLVIKVLTYNKIRHNKLGLYTVDIYATLSNGTMMALKCEWVNFSFIHVTFTSLSLLIKK